MKVAVLGAGAIGAYVGAALHRGGTEVHLIARRAHLAAMRERGVRVLSPRGDFTAHPHVTDDPAEVGEVDFVFLGLKANSYATCGDLLAPLLGPETAIVAAQNGIPWWYFHGHGGELDGLPLEHVDPGGVIAASIEPERVVGSLAYFATDIAEPGVIHHTEGNKLSLGEPNSTRSERTKAIADALIAAGLRCPVTTRFFRADSSRKDSSLAVKTLRTSGTARRRLPSTALCV